MEKEREFGHGFQFESFDTPGDVIGHIMRKIQGDSFGCQATKRPPIPLDLISTDDETIIVIDLPPGAVSEVQEQDGVLQVTVTRNLMDGQETTISRGRFRGKAVLNFGLGEGEVETDQISAKTEGGVLRITLPHCKPPLPRSIPINEQLPPPEATSVPPVVEPE